MIIIDHKLPRQAKRKLSEFGEIMEFHSNGITYDAISGHPDIFFCRAAEAMIVAPNTPEKYIGILKKRKIPFSFGEKEVDIQYPGNASFNAVITEKYFIHNLNISDPVIKGSLESHEYVHVNQGYTRCSLLALKNNHFITSDTGIYNTLNDKRIDVIQVNPEGIKIQGLKHGFFGGACGIYNDKVFIIGSLDHFQEGEKVRDFIEKLEYEIIELYDGPLFDGGSIMF